MSDLPPGSQLGGYRVATVLGRGGMGVVYLAQQLALERRVALKVISEDLSRDPEFRERFMREAQVAASLDHRRIIPVFDAGEADGRLFLSMRYVKGLDLRTVLQLEGPLEPERALPILESVGEALDAAHALGLVHRDVKPANVLIEDGPGPESERVFLTDFGLTKRVDAPSGLTRTGIFVGTPAYSSPEQCSGKPVDGRTDVYSLACVLHECLAGATPFPRDSDAQVLAAHLLEPPPRPSAVRPGLPPALDDVLAKGMAKEPADRYATCGELVAAAGAALRAAPAAATVEAPGPFLPAAPTEPIPAVPPPVSADAPTVGGVGMEVPPTLVGRGGVAPRRRRGLVTVLVLIGILLVGGVIVALAIGGGGEPKAEPSSGPTDGGTSTSPTTAPSGGPSTSSTTTGGQGGAALAAYTTGVDDLLAESADYRQRLVDAVVGANGAKRKEQREDLATVQEVIDQRQSALEQVGSWEVPPEAGAVNDLLATAFQDAIADDENYALLVQVYIDRDDAAAKQILAELEDHRAAATTPDKDAFLRGYNALRQRAGLEPLPSDFQF